jgi:hypothetical protein
MGELISKGKFRVDVDIGGSNSEGDFKSSLAFGLREEGDNG